MLKLRSKKGFTLVEALCSVSIFSILLMFTIGIKTSEIRLSKINYETVRYTYFLEALKNELISNTSKEQIRNLESNGKIYISSDAIKSDNSIIDINSIFLTENHSNKFPYVILSSYEKDGNMEVTLNMYVKFYGKEKVYTCAFTKWKNIRDSY